MTRSGCEAVVVSLLSGTMADQFREAGIPLQGPSLGTHRIPDYLASLRLLKIIRNFRPDVIHSHVVHATYGPA